MVGVKVPGPGSFAGLTFINIDLGQMSTTEVGVFYCQNTEMTVCLRDSPGGAYIRVWRVLPLPGVLEGR